MRWAQRALNENSYQLRIIPLPAGREQRLDVLRRLILLHPRFPFGIVRKKQLVSFANYYHLGKGRHEQFQKFGGLATGSELAGAGDAGAVFVVGTGRNGSDPGVCRGQRA
ncbi:protein of unknown function [Pseudomonas sp. JV551A1]|uniref:Uncharacterized protein n=1 Tax=Pseudomonas inefficax TaxID=2078786 RepID=A0AAQ1P5S7_9PSED|nr:protein of unknown function [Pseudomonas sp. JV551A1]SPO59038.1 protein of unknown function [Pseudomonas inefficax]